MKICPRCYGSGTDSSVNRNPCPVCEGAGEVVDKPAPMADPPPDGGSWDSWCTPA
jgi:DnaJ-class molecular chaperone